MSSSHSSSQLLSLSILDFANSKQKLESPVTNRLLNRVGNEEQLMFLTSKPDSLFKNFELQGISTDLQNRIHSNNEQGRIRKISKVNQMSNDIRSKSCMGSSRELHNMNNKNINNSNNASSFHQNDYKKFELMKLHNVNEIKALIDFEVYKLECKKKNEQKMKSKLEKEEEQYRKLRLDRHEKELRIKYSFNEKKAPLIDCSNIKDKLSELLSIDDVRYCNKDNEKVLATREAKKRRLDDLKIQMKNDQKKKEMELKEDNRRLIIEKRNKELINRAKGNEKKIIKIQRQAHYRSQEDLAKKIQGLEIKLKAIEENHKRHSINIKQTSRDSNDKKKISQKKIIQNTQKQIEDKQKKSYEFSVKQEIYNQRLKGKREQTKSELNIQSRLNNLQASKIKEKISKNNSYIEMRNSQLLQRIIQIEEKALRSKERKSKEMAEQCHMKAIKQEEKKEKMNNIRKKVDDENTERIIQYSDKISKLEAYKEERNMKQVKRKKIEEEIKNRKEVMLRKVLNIAHSGSFTTKNDFYQHVFNNAEYKKYLLKNCDNYLSSYERSFRNLDSEQGDYWEKGRIEKKKDLF